LRLNRKFQHVVASQTIIIAKKLFLFSTNEIFLVFVERIFLGVHCAETSDLHSAYRAPTRRERQQSALGLLWRSLGARALSLHSAPPFISRETQKRPRGAHETRTLFANDRFGRRAKGADYFSKHSLSCATTRRWWC
jgi:hypothetical protein